MSYNLTIIYKNQCKTFINNNHIRFSPTQFTHSVLPQ